MLSKTRAAAGPTTGSNALTLAAEQLRKDFIRRHAAERRGPVPRRGCRPYLAGLVVDAPLVVIGEDFKGFAHRCQVGSPPTRNNERVRRQEEGRKKGQGGGALPDL